MPFLGRPALFRCPQSACDVVELLPQPGIIQQGEVWRLEGEDAGEIRFRRVHHPQQIAAGLDGPIGIDGHLEGFFRPLQQLLQMFFLA